ncbi:DUF1330 domain-containing protein [Arenibacter algicola]|uniref:DUF1330 domain-containing protein n=1 Tax=Arenibacter TaxID=178469 RepID=UPI001C078FAB|nr:MULTISPECIES: DUF1330 domain-containing protein [Arenibacter]MBU2905835.1 DUF1330 domain-containing protein [Arenibacter algicola]MDO6602147.1 DUF1330 domain-containing protein [Arenibacter palladensis]
MKKYLEGTPDSGKQFYQNFKDKGKIIMLNLLKFKETADYTNIEYLSSKQEISGEEAYQLYLDATIPRLQEIGSEIIFYGKSKEYLIGPETEKWDAVLLVKHQSVMKFMEFAQSEDYLKYAGHRTAALEDSRLLPTTEIKNEL